MSLAADRTIRRERDFIAFDQALSAQATLEWGYAIVRRTETGELVRSVAQGGVGDARPLRVLEGDHQT